jgi:hypothetical protein
MSTSFLSVLFGAVKDAGVTGCGAHVTSGAGWVVGRRRVRKLRLTRLHQPAMNFSTVSYLEVGLIDLLDLEGFGFAFDLQIKTAKRTARDTRFVG